MLLVYYNPSKQTYYLRYYNSIHTGYFVGYKNQFEHEVVKMFIVRDKELYSVKNAEEWYFRKKTIKESLRTKVINRAIDLLYKMKK